MNRETEAYVATGPQVRAIRHLTLKQALKLELLGMKCRGRSAYSIVKQEFGFKGNRQRVYEQLVAYCEEHYS